MGSVMRMYWWLILTLLDVSEGILVYQSTITMTQKVLSGLHFESVEKLESKSSFSLCIRFNYQRLSLHNEARIFEILDLPFLWLTARYPYTWFGLSHLNWIMREIPDNYIMWIPTKWHHLCMSFSDFESSIKVVKVCSLPNETSIVNALKGAGARRQAHGRRRRPGVCPSCRGRSPDCLEKKFCKNWLRFEEMRLD